MASMNGEPDRSVTEVGAEIASSFAILWERVLRLYGKDPGASQISISLCIVNRCNARSP